MTHKSWINYCGSCFCCIKLFQTLWRFQNRLTLIWAPFVFCAVPDHAPKIGTVVICPRHGMVNVGIE